MIPVENRKQETLIPIIQQWIYPGSIIHSDCWKSYNKLSKIGYTHLTVNHSKEFRNESNAACTNAIESDWRHAKVLMPHYGVHRGMHSGYLAEFMWHRKYMDDVSNRNIYNAHLLGLIEFMLFVRCSTCQGITLSFFATPSGTSFDL